ncbi:hypothetical protein L13192_10132 [Pyrenophora tritici-repentis]|nr:hypothetical protein L13192_10132 [Pyrenophora tritici-repentis]
MREKVVVLNALLIYIPSYDGPAYKEVNGEKLIPILRSKREFMYRGHQACTRTQFPVVLAYGITIHKSQVVSLDTAVLNITDKEFAPGLAYIAVSRVRSLNRIMFEQGFDFSRFKPRKLKTKQISHEDLVQRRGIELSIDGEDNDDLPSMPPGPSFSFALPFRTSSPGFTSDYSGQDVAISGMAVPPPPPPRSLPPSGSLPPQPYPNEWRMDDASQAKLYFSCFRCYANRPADTSY